MMSDNKSKDGLHSKITSEKPVSLHPLDFDEALKALLVTPPPIEKKRKPKKRKNDNENKPA